MQIFALAHLLLLFNSLHPCNIANDGITTIRQSWRIWVLPFLQVFPRKYCDIWYCNHPFHRTFSGVVPTMDFVETASSNASSEDALFDESPKQHSLDGFYPSHDMVSCHSSCYLDSYCLCA